MRLFSNACIALALFVLVGCGGADSGNGGADSGNDGDGEEMTETVTHSGTVSKVDAEAKMITVDVDDNGTMEFTIEESTPILQRYTEVPFDSLKTDQVVGVEVDEETSTPQQVNIAE